MALTFGLRTPRDLLNKLKRDATKLNDEVSSDEFFNFVVTGYSLIDWIKHNPDLTRGSETARLAATSMYQNTYVRICGDIATAAKHFTLDRRQPVTSQVTSDQGYGVGRFGHGGYGIGEEAITIELNDGTKITCLDLAKRVIEAWETFFAEHAL